MNGHSFLAVAAAIATASIASAGSATAAIDLSGATVDVVYAYAPTSYSSDLGSYAVPGNQYFTDGLSYSVAEDGVIVLSEEIGQNIGIGDGASLTFTFSGAPTITGAAVESTTNGFTNADLSTTSSSVSVNLSGVSFGSGQETTIALNPVPEPATWAMMMVGFAGAGVVLRRRRGELALI